MSDFLRDVRYSLRTLANSPGFTAVAIATLAIGIGANTAIFSVVNGVLLKPLPYREPDRLVRAFTVFPTQPTFPMNPADYSDYRSRNRVFTNLEVYYRSDLDLSVNGSPRRLRGMQVTSGFLDLLGFAPVVGRNFRPDEERNKANVVLLSNHLWHEVFQGDPSVVGRGIQLSGQEFTVIGVMPPGIQHVGGSYHSLPFGTEVDVWWTFPMRDTDPKDRGSHFLNTLGRLKPGVTLQQANGDMNRVAAEVAKEHPDGNAKALVMPLKSEIVGASQPMILALWAAVGFVLLIACVNVANLLSARSAARRREMAVRSALGAGRFRLVRQMLAESLVLAVAGGLLGTLLAYWGVDVLVSLAPKNLPRLDTVSIDFRVLLATMAATLLTGLLFGLAPALEGLRVNPNEALKDGDRGSTAGGGRARLRATLVTAEIGLALVLLVGAGLLLRTFVALEHVDPGFQPAHVLTLTIDPPDSKYKKEKLADFYQRLQARVASIPGVMSVGFSSDAPWTGYDENSNFDIPGRKAAQGDDPEARFHFAGPGYFRTIGQRVVGGREFTAADKSGAPLVWVVNAALAHQYFPGEDAVGKKISVWGQKDVTIVGVVGDVKDSPEAPGTKPAFWWADFQQFGFGERIIAIRTMQDPVSVAQAVQQKVLELDPDIPVSNLRTMEEIAGTAISAPRYALVLACIFAGSALLLASVGIYGVISFSVTQRMHEIGIRMALGARRADVVGMVMAQGARMIVAGIALGGGAALIVGQSLSKLLYGVGPRDPVTLISFALFLAAVAAMACYVPARRATKVDPLVALRHE